VAWTSTIAEQAHKVLLLATSNTTVTSLASTLVIALAVLAIRRRQRNRPVRVGMLLRVLFPRRIFGNRSYFTDVGFVLLNAFAITALVSWSLLSYKFLSIAIDDGLTQIFGPMPADWAPAWFVQTSIAVLIFIAYEFGYWFDHYLKHRIPFLWEFHKVHHTAEVLTPLTNYRVHPVDSIIFGNILALTAAIANGFGHFVFGEAIPIIGTGDANIILIVFMHLYVHLQHTEIWIPFTGKLGHIFFSPAHHQIHHSTNPKHFDRNFGSCLAVWDWMFGTLYMPSKTPEKLVFGVEGAGARAHTITGALVDPMVDAVTQLMASLRKPDAPISEGPLPAKAGLPQ
jgi:sterol desaturase/sphingolipid hydroxylase (fatty acid hydroxylase superfamily)